MGYSTCGHKQSDMTESDYDRVYNWDKFLTDYFKIQILTQVELMTVE